MKNIIFILSMMMVSSTLLAERSEPKQEDWGQVVIMPSDREESAPIILPQGDDEIRFIITPDSTVTTMSLGETMQITSEPGKESTTCIKLSEQFTSCQ